MNEFELFIDLLSKLLEKDPTRRISLFDAKRHPWVRSAVSGRTKEEKEKWPRETDPGCVLGLGLGIKRVY